MTPDERTTTAFFVLVVAAGAYWLGTRRKRTPTRPYVLTLPTADLPPPEGALGPNEWDALAFDVDVFPDGADLQDFRPPRTYEGVSIAPDCTAIAVGHGFWAKLNAMAKPIIDQGHSAEDVWDEVRYVLFPGIAVAGAGPLHAFHACLDDEAEAALLVEDEILDRLRFLSGPGLAALPPVPVPARNPCIDPPLPTMGDALTHAMRGRR